MELDLNSPLPLHVQLKEILKGEIFKGRFSGKIPSERELMDMFSVSRTTVREAVSALVLEGVLEKRHGKGTFISLHPVKDWLGNLRSFTETIESLGMIPGARLLSQGVRTLPQGIAERLKSKEVYSIERLRYANDNPIAIERKFFPVEIGIKLSEFDLNNANIYEILEASLGIILWEAELSITSDIPSKEDAKLLNIPKTSSILVSERLTSNPEGKIVEYNRTLFRGDQYAFKIKMSRNSRSN